MPPPPASSSAPRSRRVSNILSIILFLAAIGFAVAAVVIWYRDDSNSNNNPPVPTVESGVYGLINVLTALQAEDIDSDFGRSPATVTSNQITQPGQNLRVGDTNVFIFIFPGADGEAAAAARADVAAGLDPTTMTLLTTSGQDVTNGEPLHVYEGANVIAVLVGGDPDLQADVQRAIEGLS